MCLLIFVLASSLPSVSQFRANFEFLLEAAVSRVRTNVTATTRLSEPHTVPVPLLLLRKTNRYGGSEFNTHLYG